MKKVNIYSIALGHDYSGDGVYSLGLLTAYALKWKDGSLKEHCQFHPVDMYIMADIDKILALATPDEPPIFLFSSYIWLYEEINNVANSIRAQCPGALIVIGGPMVSKNGPSLMDEEHSFDIAVFGEGEQTFVEMLEAIATRALAHAQPIRFVDLTGIEGLIWRQPDMCAVRNAARPRIEDVNIIPSPYLTNLIKDPDRATIMYVETNRGCPFGCTFCDWGGNTMSKFRNFDIERVMREIDWCVEHKIKTFYITDSNFGSFKRDIEITKYLVENKKKYGYPLKLCVSFAKNVTDRVAEIIEILYANDMTDRAVIAFQTTDQQTLNNIDRGNIKTSKFDDLVTRLKSNNVPVTTELIIGLPGQTYNLFKNDLQHFFDRAVLPVVYELTVLPNAPMADKVYQDKFSIKLDQEGVVLSTMSFDTHERERMIKLRLVTYLLHHERFIQYFLYYFQTQYGLKALDIIDEIITYANGEDATYPKLKWLVQHMAQRDMTVRLKSFLLVTWGNDAEYVLNDTSDFYREFLDFIQQKFNVTGDPGEIEALTKLQKLSIDYVNKQYPADVSVPHDVIKYFSQFPILANISDPESLKMIRPLKSFPPTTLHVPEQNKKKRKYTFHKFGYLPEWGVTVTDMSF